MDNKPTLNPALSDFWLTPARNRVLYGGRASSKSWTAAGFAIFLAQICKLRILCTRQFQNKIEESVYTLLTIQIDRFGLRDQFEILNNKITHKITGTEFLFYGLWRHIEEIKSLESVDIHWAEEAHLLNETQWEIIDPTLRAEGSQHWIIFNPRLVTDFVWRRFVVNPPPDTIVRKINYDENPFLSSTMLKLIADAKAEDEEAYNHVYLGEPKTDDQLALIQRSWIVAAIDAHKKLGIKPSGASRVGFDIAGDGYDADGNVKASDTNATVTATGCLCREVTEWKGLPDDMLGSCERVYNLASPLLATIYYDNVGPGLFAGSQFQALNRRYRKRLKCVGFGAGGAVHSPDDEYQPGVTNKDHFSNLKAQAWWSVADRFRNTYAAVTYGQTFRDDQLICIDSTVEHLDRLMDELSTPRKDYDAAGRSKVEGKKALAKRGVKSPNLADAFIMAYNPLVASTIDYGELL
jgi:phage terminase large subunit